MAWPPAALPVNFANGTTSLDTHPTAHNDTNKTINDDIVPKVASLVSASGAAMFYRGGGGTITTALRLLFEQEIMMPTDPGVYPLNVSLDATGTYKPVGNPANTSSVVVFINVDDVQVGDGYTNSPLSSVATVVDSAAAFGFVRLPAQVGSIKATATVAVIGGDTSPMELVNAQLRVTWASEI